MGRPAPWPVRRRAAASRSAQARSRPARRCAYDRLGAGSLEAARIDPSAVRGYTCSALHNGPAMGPRPETIVAHDDEFPAGAVVPPIFQTSLFTFPSYEELEATFAGDTRRPIYSRGDNPTVQVFEAKLAALEVAETARAFASGMAAISAAVLSNLGTGERMVCVRHCYPDAFRLFRTILPRFGIDVEFVDGRDADAVERALPGARVLYLESPTSMVFETQDLARLAAAARAEGAISIADNSWASPIFQRPLQRGVDLVVHS